MDSASKLKLLSSLVWRVRLTSVLLFVEVLPGGACFLYGSRNAFPRVETKGAGLSHMVCCRCCFVVHCCLNVKGGPRNWALEQVP